MSLREAVAWLVLLLSIQAALLPWQTLLAMLTAALASAILDEFDRWE